MNELSTVKTQLPTKIEDLSKFVLVGREKLVVVRAEIRAIDKLDLAKEVREQKKQEAQYLGEALLDAEARIGEMLKDIPKDNSFRGNQHIRQIDTGVVLPKPKKEVIKDLGFDLKQAERFETLAENKPIIEQVKAEARENEDIPTRTAVLEKVKQVKREEKEQKREEKRQENQIKISNAKDIKELQGVYQTILIDPPWDWSDEGDINQMGRAKPDYATMTIDELMQLPVNRLSDDNCHLYLWVTNRSLPKAFKLIEQWGFRYITCLTWVKPSFGMGNYFRGSTEQLLFAVKGSQPLKRKDVGTHFFADRGEHHSSKPETVYSLIESCSYAPYLEMFSRKNREGWTMWGEGES